MNAESLEAWLARKRLNAGLLYLLGAIALLGAGAAALFVTFWITYGVCWFTLRFFDLSSTIYLWIAGVFLVLLFIGNARTDRAYLEAISVTTGTFDDRVVTLYIPGVGMASNINPLAPDTMHSGIKIITSLLYTGPRAVTAAARFFRKAVRLFRLNVRHCAAVIGFLKAHPGRVPFADLLRGLPKFDPVAVLPQLNDVRGVVFLTSDPAGLMLSSELRTELER